MEVQALIELLALMFSESTMAIILAVFAMVAYAWTLVRTVVSPEALAKLPNWLIAILEFLAGNFGKAANSYSLDPKTLKRKPDYG